MPEFAKPDDVIPYDERTNSLYECKTVQDIIETFDELVFEEESESLLCELCFVEKESHGPIAPGQFKIDTEEEDIEDEETKPRTRKFINLRKFIKRHFEKIFIKKENVFKMYITQNGKKHFFQF